MSQSLSTDVSPHPTTSRLHDKYIYFALYFLPKTNKEVKATPLSRLWRIAVALSGDSTDELVVPLDRYSTHVQTAADEDELLWTMRLIWPGGREAGMCSPRSH